MPKIIEKYEVYKTYITYATIGVYLIQHGHSWCMYYISMKQNNRRTKSGITHVMNTMFATEFSDVLILMKRIKPVLYNRDRELGEVHQFSQINHIKIAHSKTTYFAFIVKMFHSAPTVLPRSFRFT